jgi:hypothetical protein
MRREAAHGKPRRMHGPRCYSRAVALRGPLKKRPPQGDGMECTERGFNTSPQLQGLLSFTSNLPIAPEITKSL